MKTKKLLCIILAALTLLSCFSSAFTAFAADDAVTQAKNLIDSFNGDMTVYDVKAEDLEAYHAMIQAYNALSAEEIETLDVFAFDKLLLAKTQTLKKQKQLTTLFPKCLFHQFPMLLLQSIKKSSLA